MTPQGLCTEQSIGPHQVFAAPDQPAPTMRGLLLVAVPAVGPLPTTSAGMRSDGATLIATACMQPATAASAEYKWPAIVVIVKLDDHWTVSRWSTAR